MMARTATDLIGGLERRSLAMAGEGRVRDPLGGATRSSLLEHVVDLLERQALGLRDQEVGKDNAGSARRAPDEEDLGLEVAVLFVDHVSCKRVSL